MLGSQRGSRLYQQLVRERQLASAATAFTFDLAKGSDLLVLDVTGRPGVSAEALEDAVVRVVDDFCETGPTSEELARAVALIRTDFISSMETVGNRADRLSQFATYFDDATTVNQHISRYEQVGVGDVVELARTRLGPANRASLTYVPRTEAPGAP
jgi:predicted Zn-dependent peptidase